MAGPTGEDVPAEAADWLRRPFARSFDLISKAYGWTDDQILRLSLERLRQVRDVIATREREEFNRHIDVEEAKVRALATSIYGAAGDNKGMKQAAGLRLFERVAETPKEPPSTQSVMARFGGVDRNYGIYTEEQILAEAERLKAEGLIPDG